MMGSKAQTIVGQVTSLPMTAVGASARVPFVDEGAICIVCQREAKVVDHKMKRKTGRMRNELGAGPKSEKGMRGAEYIQVGEAVCSLV